MCIENTTFALFGIIWNLPAVVGVCLDGLGVGPSEEDGVGMLLDVTIAEPSLM